MKYKYVCFILVAQRRVLYWVLLLLPNTLFLCTQCGVTLHMFIYRAIEWKRAESGFMPRYLFLLLPSEFDWLLRPVIDVLANQYILGSTPKKAFHNIQSAKEKPVITANFAFSNTNWLKRIIQKKCWNCTRTNHGKCAFTISLLLLLLVRSLDFPSAWNKLNVIFRW